MTKEHTPVMNLARISWDGVERPDWRPEIEADIRLYRQWLGVVSARKAWLIAYSHWRWEAWNKPERHADLLLFRGF